MKQNGISPYRSDIVESIQKIDRSAWDAIWPTATESWDFYRAQESSNINGFKFAYLTLYHHDKLIMIVPFFIADFSLHLAMSENGTANRLIRSIQKILPRFMVMKTLFCGGYIAEEGIIGIHPEHQNIPALFQTFDESITQYARAQKCKLVVIKDISDQTNAILSPLTHYGFSKSAAIPMMSLPLGFKDMDGYFTTISGETRKDLKRKTKKTKEAGDIHIEEVTNIAPYIEDIYQLYLNVYSLKTDMAFGMLTKESFLSFSKAMPKQTLYFMYYIFIEGTKKLIGFNMCLNHPQYLVDKFIGMDYTYAHKYNLYFISLLKNIE